MLYTPTKATKVGAKAEHSSTGSSHGYINYHLARAIFFLNKEVSASLVTEHNDSTDWSYMNCNYAALGIYFTWNIMDELLVNMCVEVAELGNKTLISLLNCPRSIR